MRRRGWILFQVAALALIATVLVDAAFRRTLAGLHRVHRALETEQAAVMLDALEQLTAGRTEDVSLTMEGWPVAEARHGAAGWTLTVRAAGAPAFHRVLPAP